jgi:hypothetical protein
MTYLSEAALREASVALARQACNGDAGRVLGDPVFEEVTEGRAHWAGYSSCGDLPQYILRKLGLKDERILNRSDDGGSVPWAIGQNLSRLVYAAGKAFVWSSISKRPKPGDILYTAMPEHVCILEKLDEKAGTISTFDYGLWDSKKGKPAGRRCVSRFRLQGKQLLVGNKLLRGWLDISRVPGLLTPS